MEAEQSTSQNAIEQRFGFNGKEFLKEEDLSFSDYGGRMYNATLGRWFVIDPMAEKYKEMSPYNYTLNDPVNKIDPDGKEVKFANNDQYSQTTFGAMLLFAAQGATGRDIFYEATGSKTHSVYVIVTEGRPTPPLSNSARDGLEYPLVQNHYDPSSNKINPQTNNINTAKNQLMIVYDSKSDKYFIKATGNVFAPLNGRDVTDDIKAGRNITLVAVASTQDISQMTYTLGRVFRDEIFTTLFDVKKYDPNKNDLPPLYQFGDNRGSGINNRPLPSVVNDQHIILKGSDAQKFIKDLIATERKMNP
jgi:RHS repeat-associated protein